MKIKNRFSKTVGPSTILPLHDKWSLLGIVVNMGNEYFFLTDKSYAIAGNLICWLTLQKSKLSMIYDCLNLNSLPLFLFLFFE